MEYLNRPADERFFYALGGLVAKLSPEEKEFFRGYSHERIEETIMQFQMLEQRRLSRGEKKTLRILASSELARKHGISVQRHAEIIDELTRLFEIE